MIICLCRAVTDRVVQASMDGGAQTVAEVERACGAGAGCGMCRSTVAQMIDERACQKAGPDGPGRGEAILSLFLKPSGEAV